MRVAGHMRIVGRNERRGRVRIYAGTRSVSNRLKGNRISQSRSNLIFYFFFFLEKKERNDRLKSFLLLQFFFFFDNQKNIGKKKKKIKSLK